MISRVADHCFWFGRYIDRAESSARLMQATASLVFDVDMPVTHCWQPLVIVSGEEAPFVARHGREALGHGDLVQEYMTWSKESQVSLATSVRAARECARAVRDQLSLELWEEINELYLWLGRESTETLYHENREEFYRNVRRSTQLILGLVRSTMLHGEPMRFLWMGVMLERAGQTARILDMHHHTMMRESAHDIVRMALWMSLLRACSGAEGFMKKHQGRVTAQSMVEFVLFESTFPRSIRYCLKAASDQLGRIWTEPTHTSRRRLSSLLAWLESQQKEGVELGQIHPLLTYVVDESAAICSRLSEEIQGPTQVSPPLPPTPPPEGEGANRPSQSQTQVQSA
ncbi:MAG: alpha-E domain-containing protein [Polyangiales bacterium]